jgi:hypothetical protein
MDAGFFAYLSMSGKLKMADAPAFYWKFINFGKSEKKACKSRKYMIL